ncbi:flavin-containing monooxygenase-like protein [Xylaria sp. FL1777]|nr:flavin-containing monooxygenase-like protein [Xylaria sp. FL1777]
MSQEEIAVIGAGALGLMAMKILREDGFIVTGYESRSYVGGLWKASDDSSLSITQGATIFNTSKYCAAISDFPFSQATNVFPTAEQIHRYLEDYCEKFDLKPNIRLNHTVIDIRRCSIGETSNWVLQSVPSGSSSPVTSDKFDKILIATGSFNIPKSPKLDGIQLFSGPVLHAMKFREGSHYQGKSVLIIGSHATAQDVAVCLSKYAAKIYMSHKRGFMMLPRYEPNGSTSDQSATIRAFIVQTYMNAWFPRCMDHCADKALERRSKETFPVPADWHLLPAPSVAVTGPLMADQLYRLFMEGVAEPVPAVKAITGPASVQLSSGRVLTGVDVIIFCTGYNTDVPFLGELNPYILKGEPPQLYRNIFPIHPDPITRESLAFLGHAVIPFPGFVLHELNAMSISQVWKGNSKLPSLKNMERWHRERLSWRQALQARQKVKGTTFYPTMLPPEDHIRWLDETAGTGIFENFSYFHWRSWCFWWRNRDLYIKCNSGLFSPTIWRLFDTASITRADVRARN